MAIQFDADNVLHNHSFNWRNRRAAMRQTEAQRDQVFAKYQALVGTVYKNSLAARRAANAELNDPKKTPEYWNEDTKPRKTLHITSSCFAKVVPSAGGVFLYFRSNPEKAYFYPAAGTTAATAERVYNLVKSKSLGKAYHKYWGAQNGARKVMSKSGKSYSYKLEGGRTLDIGKFNKIGAKFAPKI